MSLLNVTKPTKKFGILLARYKKLNRPKLVKYCFRTEPTHERKKYK